ncbi:MAG: DNA polymerase I [Verrucomicrobiota bacterium]
MAQRLFLIDGMALAYRSHFALINSPIRTTQGVNTSAVFGFANVLLDLLEKESPTHLAVVFDTSAPTFRHQQFKEYKAQREDMPEELAEAIPLIKRLAEAFGFPVLSLDGYEADDLIGTLTRMADEAGGFKSYMVTPDKDFCQLVSPTTYMWKPGRKGGQHEVLDLARVQADWQVEEPDQVVDVLGLMGDTSDNIPGVPGIGPKTAMKLISQFGRLEVLLQRTAELKGKQKERLEEHAEQALLSKRLARIHREVPLEVTLDQLLIPERKQDALQSLFVELEFNTLGKRLFGDAFKAGRGFSAAAESQGELLEASLKTLADVPHHYREVSTKPQRTALLKTLQKQSAFCFDTETTSLDIREARLLGIAFSWQKGEGHFLVLPEESQEAAEVLQELAPLFASQAEKIGHHLKYDLAVLQEAGLAVNGPFFDTMLVHALVEPAQRHTMDFLAESLLGYTPVSITSLIGDKKDPQGQLDMGEVVEKRRQELVAYACEDADVTWQLAEKLRPRLNDSGQAEIYATIEAPLLPVLVRMEREGIRLDQAALAEIRIELGERIEELRASVMGHAGEDFNLNSPKQLGEILFEKLQLIEKPKKTKTGQYVTNEQVLTSLADRFPIVAEVLEYREASKLKSTYVDALPDYIARKTGRIHSDFQQLVAATGRLASANPNLQNIPVRSALGRRVRRAFVPRGEGFVLFAADYSQIELRIMAALSGDEAMQEAFAQEADIHTATAARVYGVDQEGVLPEMRRAAKMVNFGIIYGISAFGLSQRLGIPRGEAASIIEAYFKEYAGVQAFMERAVQEARERGYAETLLGRRRLLPDLKSKNGNVRGGAERMAINTPIQGSAADMIKLAMIGVESLLAEDGWRSRMLLQVHDELVFDLAVEEAEALVPKILEAMKTALPLEGVPIVVDSNQGTNWLEAH